MQWPLENAPRIIKKGEMRNFLIFRRSQPES